MSASSQPSPVLIPHDVVAHGGLCWRHHPELGVEVPGQTAIRFLRFRRPVRVERLELPLHTGAGRWVPLVPGHPAHVSVAVLDRAGGCWQRVADVQLPADPRLAGAGLSEDLPIEAMEAHFAAVVAAVRHQLPLGGVETDHLRVECDLEHPTWPNHGECNGGPANVPFGILDGLSAWGLETSPAGAEGGVRAQRGPLLTVSRLAPRAPRGMEVRNQPHMLLYAGRRLAVGFSLRRPLLMHLGWDAWGEGGADRNRLTLRRSDVSAIGGLSGPLLRGLDLDVAAHLWTGSVSVDGAQVRYSVHPPGREVELEACFTVDEDSVRLELTQCCARPLPLLEAEAWRLAWDLRAGMTATAGLPTLRPGRNGEVAWPVLLAADGQGCLAWRLAAGDPSRARLQTESYRTHGTRTDGLVLAPRPAVDQCLTLSPGVTHAAVELEVTSLGPRLRDPSAALPAGVRRYWGSVFSCFRAELGGFSNNAASVNCHVNQWAPGELVAYTARLAGAPEPLALARFTVGRALLDGGGYGYHRGLYLDSDPILVAMAGRLHQADPDLAWLERIRPGLEAACRRMEANLGPDHLVVCRALSGNTGSFRWSSNAMDVVGFGHLDAYVNAWCYRAWRNAAVLFRQLGDAAGATRAGALAARLREAFAAQLLNPRTGWVAGWRSRDGVLHDYAFLWVNGPAIAFGLLEPELARRALGGLEDLRRQVGAGSARLGLPCNLLPIDPGDHMLARILPARDAQPTFELYTDGALSGSAGYYLRALATYGLDAEAERLATELDEGYAAGAFTGALGEGQEFLSWEGLRTGYEGTLIVRLDTLYAIAIQKGLVAPFQPEWWPAD